MTNNVFMVISLLLVLGLDLLILLSNSSLLSYWIPMLIILGVFVIFFFLENYVFKKIFADTTSPLDPWIHTIIVARNIIFVLNFIPLIQALGLVLLGGFLVLFPSALGGMGVLGSFGSAGLIAPGLFLFYVILIVLRFMRGTRQISS